MTSAERMNFLAAKAVAHMHSCLMGSIAPLDLLAFANEELPELVLVHERDDLFEPVRMLLFALQHVATEEGAAQVEWRAIAFHLASLVKRLARKRCASFEARASARAPQDDGSGAGAAQELSPRHAEERAPWRASKHAPPGDAA